MHLPERLPRENGRDYALRTLCENIIDLHLEPGSQISESELAALMGLSRTPVREAMIELARMKMVEIHPQKKSTVALIDYDLVEESRFMRTTLETAVVEIACAARTEADLARLRENVELQKFFLQNFNADTLLELDNGFHRILFEIAGKPQVFHQVKAFSLHFDRVRKMSIRTVKDLKIVQDHEAILNAVAQQDAPRARQLMEAHLSRCRVDAEALRQKYPQYMK